MTNASLYRPFIVTSTKDINRRKQLQLGHKGRVFFFFKLVIIRTHVYIKIDGKKTVKFISEITPATKKKKKKDRTRKCAVM
jgi:hypothetical protein